MRAHYSYGMGMNVLRISLPRRSMNPVLKILIAILVGSAAGLLGSLLIPDGAQHAIAETVLRPIADMWVRLLQAVSGPIVFFTALNSTFGTKKILDFGGSRFMTLARYFIISVLIVAFAMACTLLAMPSDISIAMPAQEEVTRLLDNVLKIVPSNLLEPFREANTPQLLLIAIATGYLIGALDERVGVLKSFIQQANVLGLNLANLVCTLVPYFVGLLLCLKIWTDDTGMLRFLWAPIAVAIAISIAVCLISVLCVSVVTRVSPVLLARKLWGTFCDAVKSGVLDYSSVDSLAGTCKRLLGIDGEFARAAFRVIALFPAVWSNRPAHAIATSRARCLNRTKENNVRNDIQQSAVRLSGTNERKTRNRLCISPNPYTATRTGRPGRCSRSREVARTTSASSARCTRA